MVAGILQRALGQGIRGPSGQYASTRVPMKFTSRLRSSRLDVIRRQRTDFYKTEGGANSWLMTTITMAVNPNSISFSQPKRVTKKDTQEGSTYFHFTNSKGQNNDILVLRFSGNTGNLDLRGSLSGANGATATGADTSALYKLQVWQNLYLLAQEPMLLADNSDNVFTIAYESALFPTGIRLSGFFSSNVDFTESADKPHSRQYEFEFTVTSIDPPMNELIATIGSTLSLPDTPDVEFNAAISGDAGVGFA